METQQRLERVVDNRVKLSGIWPRQTQAANEVVRGDSEGCVIAPGEDPEQMARELSRLGSHQCLLQTGAYRVYVARRYEIPTVVSELGRLRELSFRAVGEGTGLARDLDQFDNWYNHLFVWDAERKQVLGAYRLGMSDVLFRRFGVDGLYSASLFDYGADFLTQLGPALEMGRSFVRPELQRSPRVLALLWKGIARFAAERLQYRVLFGPVSVSSAYSLASRKLIAETLSSVGYRHPLSNLVAAKNPVLKPGLHTRLPVPSIAELSQRVSQLDSQGKPLPVLVKEYVRLGGQFLSFSVDEQFASAMDGLVAVNLDRTDERVLRYYMGNEGFKRFHSSEPAERLA